MNSIAIIALVLAIAGGAIAYIGDRLGTYVGKRRMSVIGLRPRHTAMLYTICSGSVIAVLTLGCLVRFDHAFERALVEGPQLLFENSQYKERITMEKARAKTSQDQAQQAQDRAQQALSQLQQAKSRLLPVQQQLLAAQITLKGSRRMLQQRQQQLGTAQAQLQAARVSLGGTNQGLRLARQEVRQAKHSLGIAEASVTTAQREVAQQRQSVQALTAQRTRLLAQNATLMFQGRSLAARAKASQQDLIFRTDQEIGRRVIKTDQPVTVIENQVTAFLGDLGQDAEQRGGRHGVNGRAVVIAVPIPDRNQNSVRDYHPLSLVQEQQAITALAQNIAGDSGSISSVVIVARAVYNSFVGEQTGIDLHPYDNLLIYPKYAVVATETIDGAQTESQILEALQAFLTKDVRPAVLLKGLIPQTDPQTGAPVVGAVDGATSLAVAQQIERLGTPVQVTAFASEDTYSSGPLHLGFRVSPNGPGMPVSTVNPSGKRL